MIINRRMLNLDERAEKAWQTLESSSINVQHLLRAYLITRADKLKEEEE